jgi:hypothetical protein
MTRSSKSLSLYPAKSPKSGFANGFIENLRKILSGLNLFEGLKPHPGNWRSTLPTPKILPHFPMVLHRGGYPDGS